ncbi:MAG: phosphatase PAP2 family protein [Armatimonadetes bacterium]|nr:phosphatase PAP2 family protein [Armatimonadota bacterium]
MSKTPMRIPLYIISLQSLGAVIGRADACLFYLINSGLGHPWLDQAMLAASLPGVGVAQSGFSLALMLLGWRLRRTNWLHAGYAGIVAFALSGAGVQVFKHIWGRPRPVLTMFDVRIVGEPLFVHSFPSGHTMTAFAVAFACSAVVPRFRFILIPLAFATGLSRVYIGAHFPLDVAYGALVGTLIGIGSARLISWRMQTRQQKEREGLKPGVLRRAHDVSGVQTPYERRTPFCSLFPVPYSLLLLLCAALFFWRLGSTPLMGLDEGLYAECSREMAASGNYITPTVNGGPFYDKPPLVYWMQAGSIGLFGVNSFAARLPSAICALALVGFTALTGTRLFGKRAGLLTGFALACSPLTAALAHMALMDQAFSLTISLALGAFLMAYTGVWPRWGYLVFWAAMGLSSLVKGPVGVLLILIPLGVFLMIRRQLDAFKHSMPIPGVLIFAIVALPWYIMVNHQTNGAFLHEFIFHQNLQRAMGQDFQHNMPFYFYPPIYLAGFFPWSVFITLAWRRYVRLRPVGTEQEASLFAAVWMLAIVGVFSLSVSKLPSYIYPALPPSALLIGLMWSRVMENAKQSSLRPSGAAAMLVAGAMAIGMFIAQRYLPEPIPGLSITLGLMGGSLALGAIIAATLIVTKRAAGAFAALCCAMVGFVLAGVVFGLPIASRKLADPVEKMAKVIAATAAPNEPVFAYRLSPPQPALGFYSGRPVSSRIKGPELQSAISSAKPCLVVTMESRTEGFPTGGKIVQRVPPFSLHEFDR